MRNLLIAMGYLIKSGMTVETVANAERGVFLPVIAHLMRNLLMGMAGLTRHDGSGYSGSP
jgi:hypothetical protein